MDVSISDEIKETAGLINAAGSWGLNEFLVFLAIFGFIAFVIIFWLLNKNANKSSGIIVDIATKTTEAINNNTNATQALIETMRNENGIHRKKLDDIHEDVKEIKFSVRRKNPKGFNDCVRGEYE